MLKAVELVRKGYFPRELPPPFTTQSLSKAVDSHLASFDLKGDVTECGRHNLARIGGFRRPLKVPNPRSYIKLAVALENTGH